MQSYLAIHILTIALGQQGLAQRVEMQKRVQRRQGKIRVDLTVNYSANVE
jgi:hypothetical protein